MTLNTAAIIAVLIVDSDLGFAFWLGQALDYAGYLALPAKNVADALALLSGVDLDLRLLILGSPQNGAESLVNFCRDKHRDLRIMRLREERNHPAPQVSCVEGEWRKPVERNAGDRMELMYAIYCLLAPEPIT